MSEAATAHLEKAFRDLRAARLLLEGDEAEASVSRAYYAVFHAATAALEMVGERPKTHKGTYDRFWVRFVEEEQFPRHLGKFFFRARVMREGADYDAFTRFDTAAASDLLEDARRFVEEAEALVERLGEEPQK